MIGEKQMRVNDMITLLVIAVCAIAVVATYLSNDAERRAFMRECQDYRNAHYACQAMWRGGITVLPVDLN